MPFRLVTGRLATGITRSTAFRQRCSTHTATSYSRQRLPFTHSLSASTSASRLAFRAVLVSLLSPVMCAWLPLAHRLLSNPMSFVRPTTSGRVPCVALQSTHSSATLLLGVPASLILARLAVFATSTLSVRPMVRASTATVSSMFIIPGQLRDIRVGYAVDPKQDLIPVCPEQRTAMPCYTRLRRRSLSHSFRSVFAIRPETPNNALQRTEAGGGLFSEIHVLHRQPLSLSLEALGGARAHRNRSRSQITMTRTLFLSLAILGVAPAVLLALVNLVVDVASRFFRPVSFSFRTFGRNGAAFDFLPALHLSATNSLLILVGSALLVVGIARIRPEIPLKPSPTASSPP